MPNKCSGTAPSFFCTWLFEGSLSWPCCSACSWPNQPGDQVRSLWRTSPTCWCCFMRFRLYSSSWPVDSLLIMLNVYMAWHPGYGFGKTRCDWSSADRVHPTALIQIPLSEHLAQSISHEQHYMIKYVRESEMHEFSLKTVFLYSFFRANHSVNLCPLNLMNIVYCCRLWARQPCFQPGSEGIKRRVAARGNRCILFIPFWYMCYCRCTRAPCFGILGCPRIATK